MSVGFVFPGQGSQSIGMLADLADSEPLVQETFAEASEVLGYDLWALCQRGPMERLNATEQTQPAMLTAGIAVWRVWLAHHGALPVVSAGHSLGEYSALVAGGVLDFATAVSLVQLRGRLMQQAVPEGEGAIAAVLGVDDDVVVRVCAEVTAAGNIGLVSAVNFNAPGQVVIAGHASAVAGAIDGLREAGARKAVPLPMSVPVHCELMRPAAKQLLQRLHAAKPVSAKVPVLQNATLSVHDTPDAIVHALGEQLYTPVQWAQTVRQLAATPVTLLIECGPGKVLSGLVRRIDRSLRCLPVFDAQSLETALAAAGETG
ncbi:MAG: [acyl-carrier-protein] S-malonyltransferase [Gammaproteobacteria bacterium]|jgi:[acyl-carrier-protein] S-malonyltransferase